MEDIKGAIIITSYNKAEYLEDSIKSALMQVTPFPLYIILSDDVSSDNSAYICEFYAQNYPDKVINLSSKKNLGLVANSYKCIKHALFMGVTHFLLLDCDDFLCLKDYFANQVSFLSNHPEFSLSFANFHYCGKNDTLESELKLRKEVEFQFKKTRIGTNEILTKGDSLCSGTIVYVSKCLDGFFGEFATDEEVKHFLTQDLPLILYQSRNGIFAKCNVNALAMRDLAESASRSWNIKKIDDFSKSCLYIRRRFVNLYEKDAPALLLRAEQLYEMKMLRRIAKAQPNAYLSRLRSVLHKYPCLFVKKTVIRSLFVYFRSITKNS